MKTLRQHITLSNKFNYFKQFYNYQVLHFFKFFACCIQTIVRLSPKTKSDLILVHSHRTWFSQWKWVPPTTMVHRIYYVSEKSFYVSQLIKYNTLLVLLV